MIYLLMKTYKELDLKLGKLPEKSLGTMMLARRNGTSIDIHRVKHGEVDGLIATFELGGKLIICARTYDRSAIKPINALIPDTHVFRTLGYNMYWLSQKSHAPVAVPYCRLDYFDVDAKYLHAQNEKNGLNPTTTV